jgi:hypothetical protein
MLRIMGNCIVRHACHRAMSILRRWVTAETRIRGSGALALGSAIGLERQAIDPLAKRMPERLDNSRGNRFEWWGPTGGAWTFTAENIRLAAQRGYIPVAGEIAGVFTLPFLAVPNDALLRSRVCTEV